MAAAAAEMGFSFENLKSRVFVMKVVQLVRARPRDCLINMARPAFNINSLPHLSPGTEWRRLPLGLPRQLSSERESRERDGAGSDDVHGISLYRPHTDGGDCYGRQRTIHGKDSQAKLSTG